MKAIVVRRSGGPEVLQFEEIEAPRPGPGEAIVGNRIAGVNFIDVYYRTGLYPAPLPFVAGVEGAGTVLEVGEGVTEVQPGDRVAYAMTLGAYAEKTSVQAWKLVSIPDSVEEGIAAAAMVQGMTAHYLTHSTFPLEKGHFALVHAAAGGVGLLLVQIAKRLGAIVIGTVSTTEKARLAKGAGADFVVIHGEQDFEEECRRVTNNRGVDVAYDSIGQATWEKSLRTLATRGYLVLFGQSSGPVPPIDPLLLSRHGSLFITRPSLAHYAASREELLRRSQDLFRWLAEGSLKLRIDSRRPLLRAAEAHAALESRATQGKLLLEI